MWLDIISASSFLTRLSLLNKKNGLVGCGGDPKAEAGSALEFKASLVYIASARPARDPVLGEKKNEKKKNDWSELSAGNHEKICLLF